MKQFHTKVVGVTFDGRQECIRKMKIGERIRLERDPNNPHDANAVKVLNERETHRFHFQDLARKLAAKMDRESNTEPRFPTSRAAAIPFWA